VNKAKAIMAAIDFAENGLVAWFHLLLWPLLNPRLWQAGTGRIYTLKFSPVIGETQRGHK
jgi:hypothetical protein